MTRNMREGFDPFITRETVDMLAIQYQEGLLNRLNVLTRGTPLEHESLLDTVIKSAPDRRNVLVFNYASQALNNAFFLSRLRRRPMPMNRHSAFAKALIRDFGSVETFQHHFSSAVMGMMGSGWMWLVADSAARLGVVGTYGPGTLLTQNRAQRGDYGELAPDGDSLPGPREDDELDGVRVELDESSYEEIARQLRSKPLDSTQQRRTFSTSAVVRDLAGMSADEVFGYRPTPTTRTAADRRKDLLIPLLCLSVHEHAWLREYGIWGKEPYVENFWQVVDWRTLEEVYEKLPSLSGTKPRES